MNFTVFFRMGANAHKNDKFYKYYTLDKSLLRITIVFAEGFENNNVPGGQAGGRAAIRKQNCHADDAASIQEVCLQYFAFHRSRDSAGLPLVPGRDPRNPDSRSENRAPEIHSLAFADIKSLPPISVFHFLFFILSPPHRET